MAWKAEWEDDRAIGSRLLRKWGYPKSSTHSPSSKTSSHFVEPILDPITEPLVTNHYDSEYECEDDVEEMRDEGNSRDFIAIQHELQGIVKTSRIYLLDSHQYSLVQLCLSMNEAIRKIEDVLNSNLVLESEREHIFRIMTIYKKYSKIAELNNKDDRFVINNIYRITSSEKEIGIKLKSMEDNENLYSWEPLLGLEDLYSHLTTLKDDFSSEYELYELWWLSISVSFPQILYHIHWKLIDKTQFSIESEIDNNFNELYLFLQKWKSILQSESVDYLENEYGPTHSISTWEGTTDSAYVLVLYNITLPAWINYFWSMGYSSIQTINCNILIWKKLVQFSNSNLTLFPLDALDNLNQYLIKKIYHQCQQICISNFELLDEEENSIVPALLISSFQFISPWIEVFSNKYQKELQNLLVDYYSKIIIENSHDIEKISYLLKSISEWATIFTIFEYIGDVIMEDASQEMPYNLFEKHMFYPSNLFKIIILLKTSKTISDSMWERFLSEFFKTWNEIGGKVLQSRSKSQIMDWYTSWNSIIPQSLYSSPSIYVHFHYFLMRVKSKLESNNK